MRLIVCALIICALLGYNSEQKLTGADIVNGIAKTQYYSSDSVPFEIAPYQDKEENLTSCKNPTCQRFKPKICIICI